jgi:hypothetical protein
VASLTYLLVSRNFNMTDEAEAVAASVRMLAEPVGTRQPVSAPPR